MRALAILAGLLLGILAGTSLVLGNPLAWFRGLPPLSADIAPARTYRWDDTRGMAGAVTDLLGVGRTDRATAFADPALAHVRAGIVVVPAGAGSPAALAVKVAAVDPGNALWKAQLGTDDFWLIAWPGEGSLMSCDGMAFIAVSQRATPGMSPRTVKQCSTPGQSACICSSSAAACTSEASTITTLEALSLIMYAASSACSFDGIATMYSPAHFIAQAISRKRALLPDHNANVSPRLRPR